MLVHFDKAQKHALKVEGDLKGITCEGDGEEGGVRSQTAVGRRHVEVAVCWQ